MNAPLPDNEAERLKALYQCNILDTAPEPIFEDITWLATSLCAAPIALISLVDPARQWFKSRVGLTVTETPRDIAFCAHAILQPQKILVVRDACADERFAANPLVTSDPGIRFYAGVPIVTSEGYAIGALCVIDREPRDLSPEHTRALRSLGRQVAVELELRRKIVMLEHEQVERKLAEAAAQQAVQVKSEFICRVSHELRTPMTAIKEGIDIILDGTAGPLNTDQRDFLETAKRNVDRLARHIYDILDFQRLENGRMDCRMKPEDLTS